jgi:hypothetical protein
MKNSLNSVSTCLRVVDTRRRDGSLSNFDVLLHSACAGAHCTYYMATQHDGNTATEYHDLSRIALLDTKERLARLRKRCQFRRRFVEESCGHSFVDRKIDAADQRAILTYESHQMSAGVNDRNIVCKPYARGFRLGS